MERTGTDTPAEQTLKALQNRLNEAEGQAKTLVSRLGKYGFKKSHFTPTNELTVQKKNTDVASRPREHISPLKLRHSQLQQSLSCDELVGNVYRVENTLQSLKLGMDDFEAERTFRTDRNTPNIDELQENHHQVVNKLNKEIVKLKKEKENLKSVKKEFANEIKQLKKKLEVLNNNVNDDDNKLGDLKLLNQNLITKINELKCELSREVDIRQSLEEAHSSLLKRVTDMDNIVESERGQVQTLATNCKNLSQEAVANNEAFQMEHDLRIQLEALVIQQEEDMESANRQEKEASEEKTGLVTNLSKYKRENKILRQQFENVRRVHEDVKISHEGLIAENHKLQEALKMAATDNKALISQQKEVIKRGRHELSVKIAEQDKILKTAKEAMLKELDQEKTSLQQTGKENFDLKTNMKELERKLEDREASHMVLNRKYETEVGQLKDALKLLSEERFRINQEKDTLINELDRELKNIKEEKYISDTCVKELQFEVERFSQNLKISEDEKSRFVEQLASAEQHKLSQQQIEGAMAEMVETKNKLAYGKGLLQSKIEKMQLELNSMSSTKIENDQLKKTNVALRNQYNKVSIMLQSCTGNLQRMENEVKQTQASLERKDKDIQSLIHSREEALQDGQKLVTHTESLERERVQKIEYLQKVWQDTQAENRKMAGTLESVISSHTQLQSTMENLQTELGRKDSEINTLNEERNISQEAIYQLQNEFEQLQQQLVDLEVCDSQELESVKKALIKVKEEKDKLSELLFGLEKKNNGLTKEVQKLQLEITQKSKAIFEVHKEREKAQKEVEAEKEQVVVDIETTANKKINKLKRELLQTKKRLREKEEESAEMKIQLKDIRTNIIDLEKSKKNYSRKNKEQEKAIEEFVSQICELQTDLKGVANTQVESSFRTRQQEEELEKEKLKRLEAESKLKALNLKEKDLERRLQEANLENGKIANNLKDAQKWFKYKLGQVEDELDKTVKAQCLLEQNNTEQQRLVASERRRAEETTSEARKLVRASRLTVNKLASEVAENSWETKGLKHVLTSERDNASRAIKKYERLLESSSRKIEEMGKELERAHEKAKKVS